MQQMRQSQQSNGYVWLVSERLQRNIMRRNSARKLFQSSGSFTANFRLPFLKAVLVRGTVSWPAVTDRRCERTGCDDVDVHGATRRIPERLSCARIFRLQTVVWRFEHMTPVLRNLHWLPVRHRFGSSSKQPFHGVSSNSRETSVGIARVVSPSVSLLHSDQALVSKIWTLNIAASSSLPSPFLSLFFFFFFCRIRTFS